MEVLKDNNLLVEYINRELKDGYFNLDFLNYSHEKYFGVFLTYITTYIPDIKILKSLLVTKYDTKDADSYYIDITFPVIFKVIDNDIVQDINTKQIFKLCLFYHDDKTIIDYYDEEEFIKYVYELNNKLGTSIPVLMLDIKDILNCSKNERAKYFFKVNDKFKKVYGDLVYDDHDKIEYFINEMVKTSKQKIIENHFNIIKTTHEEKGHGQR